MPFWRVYIITNDVGLWTENFDNLGHFHTKKTMLMVLFVWSILLCVLRMVWPWLHNTQKKPYKNAPTYDVRLVPVLALQMMLMLLLVVVVVVVMMMMMAGVVMSTRTTMRTIGRWQWRLMGMAMTTTTVVVMMMTTIMKMTLIVLKTTILILWVGIAWYFLITDVAYLVRNKQLPKSIMFVPISHHGT